MKMNTLKARLSGYLKGLPKPATRWGRSFSLALLTGLIAGSAAAALEYAIELGSDHLVGSFTHLGKSEVLPAFNWAILLLPAAGGLIAGLFVHLLSPKSKGHGVELLTRAFHRHMGQLEARGPTVKAAGAAMVMSTGGSVGPEGPIAALGAAIGSTVGKWFPTTPHERRILLVAGAAAGIGAIFRCPLGGALFAASVLYRDPDFESDAIVPSVVASVIGYTTFMAFRGFAGPMLSGVSTLQFASPIELLPYFVLGPLCGLITIFFSMCFRVVEERIMPRSPLPVWLNPALGGLVTGALACLLPQVMDGRYIFIQNALSRSFIADYPQHNWWVWAALFGAIALAKCIATAFSVGSGMPGGLLGPSVFIGGVVGAFLGAVCEALMPGAFPETLRQALIPVGMAGVLAAAMRTPLAAIVMVTEMTGSYGLVAPLMLVCISSYVIGRRWGLNKEQVRSAAESPAHVGDSVIHILESLRVGQMMSHDWALTVAPDAPLDALVQRIEPGTRPVIAVARDGELLGLISPSDLGRVLEEPEVASMLVASDVMTRQVTSVRPGDDVYFALNVFQRTGFEVLPVLSDSAGRRRWLGMLSRSKVVARLRQEMGQNQASLLSEHAGLAAIGQDLQLQQILLPVSSSYAERVQRLFVPMQVVGQSLRASDFRRKFKAQVIAVEQRDGAIQCPPNLDAPLRTDQRLWVIATGEESSPATGAAPPAAHDGDVDA